MKCPKVPARYILALMGFFGNFTRSLLKIGLSVAIVDMVDFERLEKNDEGIESSSDFEYFGNATEVAQTLTQLQEDTMSQCPDNGASMDEGKTKNSSETKFLWNASQQGLILSSYSYGVVSSLVVGAYLGRRFGHVRVLGLCILTSSVFTLITPVAALSGGYIAMVIVRIIIGMLTGLTTATLFGLAGIWSPPGERSKIVSFIMAGIPFGISFVMPVAGLLADAFGWQSVFYGTGTFAAVWSILWLALIYETPEKHPRISDKERRYIQSSLSQRKDVHKNKPPIPWLKIFTSGPFICLVIVHFCSVFGRSIVTSMLPTYLRTILNFDVEMSGILSAIPFVVSGILLFVCGPLADCIISKGIKAIYVRKTFTTIGLVFAGASMVAVPFAGCNITLSLSLFTVIVGMEGFIVPGFKSCLMEIAPEFSGVVFSISGTLANVTGILAPQATGSLRQAYGELGWKIAFWMGGAIYIIGAIVFLIFGTNQVQPWAVSKRERSTVTTVTETLATA